MVKNPEATQLREGAPAGICGRRPGVAPGRTDISESEKEYEGLQEFSFSVGLVVALAFSALIAAFTSDIINPIIQAFTGGKVGLGFQIRSGNPKTVVDIGAFISAIIYFVIFMAVIYFLIVQPYKLTQSRLGQVVFGDPPPVKTCPACLSSDLPAAASKCKYCGTDQPVTA
jgi:large conductance mechanosensitive channel